MAAGGFVGAGLGAIGAHMDAESQFKISRFNAAQATREAEAARQVRDLDRERNDRRARRVQGAAEAAFASTGAGTNVGVLADSAAELELDARISDFNAQLVINEAESRSGVLRFQARQARRAGFINAASEITGAFGGKGGKVTPAQSGAVDKSVAVDAAVGAGANVIAGTRGATESGVGSKAQGTAGTKTRRQGAKFTDDDIDEVFSKDSFF